jgi:pSer/pThr/pTyr-binding forkhead associated (FHA) protein
MANLNDMIVQDPRRGVRLSGQTAEQPEAAWQEMLAPEVIVPEGYDDQDESKERRERRRKDRRQRAAVQSEPAATTHLLVFLGAEHPIKYPLYKDVMTIGRSEGADIQIDGHFISRIHARIVRAADKVTIEDAGSKNGISINSETVSRHELKHGDVIGIGKLRFTFVEVGAEA